MKGLNQFRDDLHTLRLALIGRMPSDLSAQALDRCERFADMLEALSADELPKVDQSAPTETAPIEVTVNTHTFKLDAYEQGTGRVIRGEPPAVPHDSTRKGSDFR